MTSLVTVTFVCVTVYSQLRKVEDRKKQEEEKRTPTGRFDVHSIMNRAFEVRRKALEASDTESEDGSSEEDWN